MGCKRELEPDWRWKLIDFQAPSIFLKGAWLLALRSLSDDRVLFDRSQKTI